MDHASKIGWTKFLLAISINVNDTIKPINKLPLSPKKTLGNFNNEKLNNKKIIKEIITKFKNINKSLSEIKKYKIKNVEIVAKLKVPFIPSK